MTDVSSFTTDAKFRSWGSAVSAAIVASGLTVTADTGQINWTTVTRPTAANTKAGYEIYRFNDTAQATYPIYLRIDYGSSAQASGQGPATWLTVGTGSDGAGNITGTGLGMPVTQSGNGSSTASTNTAMMVGASYSATAGALTINAGMNYVSTVHAGLWLIMRSCDTAGTPNGNAIAIYRCSASATAPTMICDLLSPATTFASRSIGCANFSTATTITAGTTLTVHKHYVIAPIPYPTLGAITLNVSDAAPFSIVTVAAFGSTTHKYLFLGTGFQVGADNTGAANSGLAVIWE